MKILAIEKELKTMVWEDETQTLIEEAKQAYQLMLMGSLREIYFTGNNHAVLMLECEDTMEAKELVGLLPLVKKGIIDFDIFELKPYTGFTRLMNLV